MLLEIMESKASALFAFTTCLSWDVYLTPNLKLWLPFLLTLTCMCTYKCCATTSNHYTYIITYGPKVFLSYISPHRTESSCTSQIEFSKYFYGFTVSFSPHYGSLNIQNTVSSLRTRN